MKQLIKIATLSILTLGLTACVSSSPGSLAGYKTSGVGHYECGSDAVTVTYLTKDQNSIALLSINKEPPVLLANAVAASGARYIGGIYQFWEKGESASLTNFMTNPKQGTQCQKTS